MTHPFEEQFGPGPYHFVAYWEMPSQGLQAANPEAYNNALRGAPRTGEPDALSVRVGACHHCGTGIIHHYILRTPTGRTFIVGSDCVYKIAPKTEVAKRVRDHVRERVNAAQRAKRDMQREMQRKARESAWRREGAAKAREFFKNVCSQYPMDDLKAALRQNRRHTILKDMLDRLMRWGTLSEKQIAFALQLAADLDRPVDVFDGILAEGRQRLEGEILTVKAQDDPYRYNATVLKMLVKVEVQGGLAKVWGTMPAALDAGRGDRVAFDAKVTPKERGFGFFSRPTKAEVVA